MWLSYNFLSFVDDPTFELNMISSGKAYDELLSDYLSFFVVDKDALNLAVYQIKDVFCLILEEGEFEEFGIFESKISDSKGHSVFFVNENNTLLVLNMLRNAF